MNFTNILLVITVIGLGSATSSKIECDFPLSETDVILVKTTDELPNPSVACLAGTWDKDRSHIANEFGYVTKVALVVTIVVSWTTGVVCGTLVIKHILADGIFRKPINSLIFFEEVTAMIRAFTILLFADNIMAATDTIMPPIVCKVSTILSMFCIISNICTGWIIALMRVLYVWFPTKMVFREVLVSNLLHILLLFMTTGFSLAWSLGPIPNRIRDTVCYGVGHESAIVQFDYQGLKPTWGPRIVAISGAWLIVSEFFFYAAIFNHLYRHNQTMSVFLPEEKVKKRLRTNVVNLTGNVLKFVLKLVWMTLVVTVTLSYGSNIPALTLVLWIVNFGIIELLQILVSPKIGNNVTSKMKALTKSKAVV